MMARRYDFSASKYFIHTLPKYLLLWLFASGLTCAVVVLLGVISLQTALIISGFFLVVSVLIFINRVRTQKKSYVKLVEDRVEYFRVIYNGYEPEISLGKRGKTGRYTVIRPTAVELHGQRVILRGNVMCAEETYDSGTTTRRERTMKSFSIPPYFSDWQAALEQLKHYEGD